VPIKAFYGALPSCDDMNACTTDAWDGTQCTHTPLAQGTTCRAALGACDVAEVCDGTGAACPADALRPAGFVCSATPKRVCSGKTAACR
jgi:hypothetical protein